MKITNRLNLPEALVKAVSVERHNKPGSYSATTLLKGVKETILQERHWEELETDVSDSIWAVWGTAVHAIFENMKDNTFHEEYFEQEVNGLLITGRVDSYDLENETLNDWKTASVYKIMKQDFKDWRRQGLIYAWLMNKAGLKVRKCRFIALLKDHSKTKAKTDAGYPQSPTFVYEFDVTEDALVEVGHFIEQKVNALKFNYELPDDEISECTADERWCDPPKFAVMKKGRKTALKLFDDETLANAFIELQPDKTACSVEYRPSISRKCSEYCACHNFCNFWKNEQKALEAKDKE